MGGIPEEVTMRPTDIFVALFMLPFCFIWFILDIFEVFTDKRQ